MIYYMNVYVDKYDVIRCCLRCQVVRCCPKYWSHIICWCCSSCKLLRPCILILLRAWCPVSFAL